ncbi:MAG TPA: SAM-dependent methyltransferase, partial [Polyangiaceae bacterium]|nr:SAM-dependent methyltransferase [Polyangiaceae bacterium]
MHLVLAAADSGAELARELSEAFPGHSRELRAGMFACDLRPEVPIAFPHLAFARQVLPQAREVEAPSIRTWANLVVEEVVGVLPDHAPWALHVFPFEQAAGARRVGARAWHTRARAGKPLPLREEPARSLVGHERCRLIREAVSELLQKRRRHLLRSLRRQEEPFAPDEALAQLVLSSPEQGFFSLAKAPLPFEQRHVLSHFSGGEVALARDKEAPSRAFAKLVEAEARLGRRISAGETCVDLGAAPGSWTYVAVQRGARVTAVDRAELRADLAQHANVRFQRGDAFRYEPPKAVDWLLCDVIASAERSAELVLTWLRQRWCRRFVVTLKVSGADGD